MGKNLQPCDMQDKHADQISLLDIAYFLHRSYKTVIVSGLIGLIFSISYIATIPKQYEANAQIIMAQIGVPSANNLNPLGVNIEEPALLISRLSFPTSFTPEAVNACGLEGRENSAMLLSKSIRMNVSKGVGSAVDLKTFGSTPHAALLCADAIFSLIKSTQAQILEPYIEDAKMRLTDDEARLQRAINVVAKADKSGQAMSAIYLATRDEIRFLLDEITALRSIVGSNQNRATRLVAPIYSDIAPMARKKIPTIVAGLLGGIFLGLLLSFGMEMAVRLKGKISRS